MSGLDPVLSGPDPLPDLAGVDAENPLVVVVSACLLGEPVGYDGSAFPSDPVQALCALPCVRAVPFCPETHAMGVPRRWMTIHGGDGFAVLDGTAKVVNVDGRDLSDHFRLGAQAMLTLARSEGARLAILTDISPSCGSTVIYDGEKQPETAYRSGTGVTAALLRRYGLAVVSQRDARTLGVLREALDPSYQADPDAHDHIDGPWYRQTFLEPAPPSPDPVLIEE